MGVCPAGTIVGYSSRGSELLARFSDTSDPELCLLGDKSQIPDMSKEALLLLWSV